MDAEVVKMEVLSGGSVITMHEHENNIAQWSLETGQKMCTITPTSRAKGLCEVTMRETPFLVVASEKLGATRNDNFVEK